MGQQAMEIKALTMELKADDQGVIEGYGSVFGGVDAYGDTIEPGAFAASIGKRKPKMLWQHRMDRPIGVWDEVVEDAKGLRLKGRLAQTELAKEARELIGMGALDGLSIGYRTLRDEMRGNNRVLKEVDLLEVSFVTFPADDSARVTGIKAFATERDFETMLREQGFSRWDAKTITAGGWKAWLDQRDAEGRRLEADQRDAEALRNLKTSLQLFLKENTK